MRVARKKGSKRRSAAFFEANKKPYVKMKVFIDQERAKVVEVSQMQKWRNKKNSWEWRHRDVI